MRLAHGHLGRACAVGVALALVLVGCSEMSTPEATTPVPDATDRVVLIGDSLGEQTAPYLKSMVGERAFEPRVFGGTAPCDWLGKDLAITPTTVAVVSFVGNSLTPCMADGAGGLLRGQPLLDKYRSDVTALVAQVRSSGGRVLLVGQPQTLGGADGDMDQASLNELYASLVEPDAVEFVDAGTAVEDADGAFTMRLPCLPNEAPCDQDGTIAVRSEDGVHFCSGAGAAGCVDYSSGAFRFAAAIAVGLDFE